MTATVAQLGARALRKLGIAIVADSARPANAPVVTAATVAVRALRELGMAVPEADRPASLPPVASLEIAKAALRAVGVNPLGGAAAGFESGGAYTMAQLAQAALTKLAVIAADETPSAEDQNYANLRVTDVHDTLVGMDLASWSLGAVPAGVAEAYIIMAANLLAPAFGKPAAMDAYNAAIVMVRQFDLSGARGQAVAVGKVAQVHETLNALGLVAWTLDAVPAAFAADYVAMTAILLGSVMGRPQDAQSRQVDRADWEAAETNLRKAGVIRAAQARALDKVTAVQAELNALGLVTWDVDHIPGAVADAMASMAVAQMAPEFGKDVDPKLYQLAQDRVRLVSMGGPAGQALAEQKIRAVHLSLDARGRARWTLFDLPDYAEEPYVFMAAVWLAPECGVKADPNWWGAAEAELMRIASLPSNREPVAGAYF